MNPCPPRPSSLDAQALPSGFFRQKPQFSVTCSVWGAVLMWPLVALLVAFSLEFQGFVPIAVARVCIQDHMQGRRGFFPPPDSHGRLLGDPWSSLGEASPHATSCVLHLSSPPGSSEEGRVGVSDPSCVSVGYLQSEAPSHPVPRGDQSRGLFSSTDSKEAQVLHLHPRLFPDRLVVEGGDKSELLHFKTVAAADGVAAHVHVGGESCQISDGLDVAFEGGSVSDEAVLLNAPFNSDLGTSPKPAGAYDARLGGFPFWGAPNRKDAHDALHSNYECLVPETLWKKAHFSHAGDLEWVDGPSYYPSLRKNQFLHKDGSASVSSTDFARAFSGLTALTPCKHCSFCSGPRDLCAQHQRECRDFADVCLKVLQQEPHMWQLAEVHVDVLTLCLECLQSKYNKATSAPRPSVVTGPKFFPSAFLEDQGDIPRPGLTTTMSLVHPMPCSLPRSSPGLDNGTEGSPAVAAVRCLGQAWRLALRPT